jgi:hypothetical protein
MVTQGMVLKSDGPITLMVTQGMLLKYGGPVILMVAQDMILKSGVPITLVSHNGGVIFWWSNYVLTPGMTQNEEILGLGS